MPERAAVALTLLATAALILSPDFLPDLPRVEPVRVAPPRLERAGDFSAPAISSQGIATLPAAIDGAAPGLMAQQHVVGAAVAVVHDGHVIFERGYGKPSLESVHSVDPSRTIFRIGSVTKIMTALALLQLAERGVLDLDRDIRDYLPDVRIRYPTTARQLLTHTAGFDEQFAGGYTDSAAHLESLEKHVPRQARQFKPPGGAYTYSNTNYAVAGLIVERLTGGAFDDYMEGQIFEPLDMSATTAGQPRKPTTGFEIARGYEWRRGRHELLPSRLTQSGPAGAVTTTATDMARLMIALLSGRAHDGATPLSRESVYALLSPQFVAHPRISEASTFGLSVLAARGKRFLYRGGTLGDHAAMVLLFPDERLGIFVVSNGLPGLGDYLFDPVMTHLLGPAVPTRHALAPRDDSAGRADPLGPPGSAAQVAGMYRDFHHTRHDMSRIRALMPMIQSPVTPNGDGAVRWRGRDWSEIEPLVFRALDARDGDEYIVFRADHRGRIRELHAAGSTYERIGWLEQRYFHLGSIAVCLVAFAFYAAWRARSVMRHPAAGQIARVCALVACAANLGFVAGLVVLIRQLGATTPLPKSGVLLLSLPLIGAAVACVLPALCLLAWRRRWWTVGERVAYSGLAAAAVAFATLLNYWKLLGFRY